MRARPSSMEYEPMATGDAVAFHHAAALAGPDVQWLSAHRRTTGGNVRPQDFHRGGPG